MIYNAIIAGLSVGLAAGANAAHADSQPVLTIPLVDQMSFPLLGSLIAYTPQSTVIRLGCAPSDLTGGDVPAICAFNSTITYGPSTYALTVPNNDFGEGPTTVTCNAVSSTPQSCVTVEQQSTFAAITNAESVDSGDLTTAEVTITAGADKISGSAAPSSSSSISSAASASSVSSAAMPASTTSAVAAATSVGAASGSGSSSMTASASAKASGNAAGAALQAGVWVGAVAGPLIAVGVMAL